MEMMKIPGPNFNMLYQEVRMGLSGIHELHKYLRTQLPFPYVHMITLLVNVNNMVMAIVMVSNAWQKGLTIGNHKHINHNMKYDIISSG